MATTGDIAAELRTDEREVAFLDGLGAPERSMLLETIREAAAIRDDELRAAVDGALGFIPRPLRGRVVKLLGGGRG